MVVDVFDFQPLQENPKAFPRTRFGKETRQIIQFFPVVFFIYIPDALLLLLVRFSRAFSKRDDDRVFPSELALGFQELDFFILEQQTKTAILLSMIFDHVR